MTDRDRENASNGDLPWGDVPADSDMIRGTEEPDPAEVEGDEGDEVDVSRPPIADLSAQYHRDTLDERLAEEVPDVLDARVAGPGEIMAAEDGEDELLLDLGEPDVDDSADVDAGENAEDAALHVTDRP